MAPASQNQGFEKTWAKYLGPKQVKKETKANTATQPQL